MNTQRDDVATVFNALTQRLASGWLAYVSVKHLSNAYESNRVSCARFFLAAAYQAQAAQAIAGLDQLLSVDGLLAQLLDGAQAGANGFPYATPTTLAEQTQRARQLIQAWPEQRRELASAQQSLILPSEDDPTAETVLRTFPPQAVMALDRSYRALAQQVGALAQLHKNQAFTLEHLEEYVQDDVEFLMELMGGGCF